MSFFALSKVLFLAVAASCALGAFSPPLFAMTSWDTPVASAGVRLYGSTPDRSGILELSLDGKQNASSTLPYTWHANVHLLGTVVTAFGSDFAVISTQGGGQVVVFFIRNNGALSYIQSSNASTATWTLGLVGGGPQPAPGTSLGAAMWAANLNHMSVFYQDAEGIIYESEFKNGTWAAPVDFAVANVGTDINIIWTTSTSGLSKFVYLQSVRNMQEWRYSSSSGQWSQTSIAGFPAQSSVANIRLAVGCIANGDAYPCRMWSRPTGSNTMGLRAGLFAPAGVFTPFDPPSLDVAATSDVAVTVQFAGGSNNWHWIVFTGADGTLQLLPWRASVGWGPPSQIVPAPNKVKGAA